MLDLTASASYFAPEIQRPEEECRVDEPEEKKLGDLTARIRAAEEKSSLSAPGSPSHVAAEPAKASQTGYELVGTIIACVIIGWLFDRYLHTKPWGIIGMLVVGFIAGMLNIWRALNGYDQSVGLHKKDSK